VYGKEAAKLALDVIRLGRAFGVILIQATQRPDADSLPKGISANAGIRIALRIMDDYANNAILGAGMYAAGVRATDFTTKDKGVAWLVGIGDEPVVAKSYNITAGMAEKIGERARRLREEHDRLTGAAAGLVVAAREERAAGHDLLADIRRMMAEQGAGWMWTQHAAAALAVADRSAYEGLTAEILGKMLGARGVRTGQINRADPHDGTRRNWQGFELTQIVEAMEDRTR
jgi:DNA segregation ATPase FtsK/SpoIIIE, S-DNA-T family